MTTISNIQIKPKGKTPGEVEVTVTADVANADGHTPQITFPAQGGMPMTNTGGNSWTASDTQMYDGGKKTIIITCNGAEAKMTFTP